MPIIHTDSIFIIQYLFRNYITIRNVSLSKLYLTYILLLYVIITIITTTIITTTIHLFRISKIGYTNVSIPSNINMI